MKKQPLSVRPVRRYRRPRYPSWQAPNPLDHPETVPYPLRRRAWQALLASGLVSSLAMSQPEGADETPAHSYAAQADSLINPFTRQQSGLPYHAPFYGTGQPERLRDKEARAVLDRAFAEQGIHLQANYLFQSGAFSLLLSGYDPKHKTGYVFISQNRMDKNAFRYQYKTYSELPTLSEAYLQRLIEHVDIKKDRYLELSSFLKKQLTAARKEPDLIKRRELIRKAALEEIVTRRLKTTIPAWLREQIETALLPGEMEQREAAIARCAGIIDLLYSTDLGNPTVGLRPIFEHVALDMYHRNKLPLPLPDIQGMLYIAWYYRQLGAWRYDYPPGPEPDDLQTGADQKHAAIREALSATGEALDANIRLLAREADAFFVSMPDIAVLDSLAQRGEAFIAPVSQYDDRLGYLWLPDEYSAELTGKLAAAEAAGDTAAVRELRDELQQSKPARLQELEKNARQYVLWAREQGRF